MFQKVLIAEDMSSINTGLHQSLIGTIPNVITAHYCDEALLKAKLALQNNSPFDLLISDLSFTEDHRTKNLTSGQELIIAIKKKQPNLKIIVFSMEGRIGKIKQLLDNYKVNAFVQKGPEGLKEIKKAITAIAINDSYISSNIQQLLKNGDNIDDIDDTDIFILKLLSEGIGQDNIPDYLKNNSYPNYKLRSVQDRIKKLKEFLQANNSNHLISIAKDQGLI